MTKRKIDAENNVIAEPCGVVVADKPAGMTSFDVVAKMRRIYGTRRVGHTGTLDPDATGVLVVLVGRAAKATEYITVGKKRYIATLRLGITTDTEDISGKILTENDVIPPEADVVSAAESFKGEYMQVPPMYSALKRDGEKLVDLARRGITVEREARRVEIYALSAKKLTNTDYELDVECSHGTYIRTLCADIGERLGCGGCMASLRRGETGGFTLDDAATIEEIAEAPEKHLLKTDVLFSELATVNLSGKRLDAVKNGVAVSVDGVKENERVRLYDDDGVFFGLGEAKHGTVKCIKFFVI